MKDSRTSHSHLPLSIDCIAPGRDATRAAAWEKPAREIFANACCAVVLGLSYHFAVHASADAGIGSPRSALTWLAPAAGIALLWRRRMREWSLYVLLGAAAIALAVGHTMQPVDVAMAVIGFGEVLLAAWLGRRWVAPDGQLDSSRRLLLFTLLLPLGAALLHSVLASALLRWNDGPEGVGPWTRIYVADAMGMFTLVPALLTLGTPAAGAVLRDRSNWLRMLAALACLGLALVPRMEDEVVRIAFTLLLGWTALRSGVVLVAQLNAVASVAMVVMLMAGIGPYIEYGLWTLQVDMLGIALLTLLLAVVIAERQRLAARLDQARRLESLGFLAGGVAHDFNNLLGTIRACAEIASDRMPPGSPGHAELEQLARETERGTDMTQQILLAARQGDPSRADVDLGEVVDEVIRMARALCPPHVSISRVPGSAAPMVRANRGQLLRAVQNLLRNAVQAARHEVRLTVGTQAAAAGARYDVMLGDPHADHGACGWVDVADDGPGIDTAHWPHLFDPFYSTRFAQGGSGLGLAIVAGVASGHGGFVGMLTAPGRGTLFRLEVPRFAGGHPGTAATATPVHMKESTS